MNKKEKELKKYLDKKKTQKLRDSLMSEIAALDGKVQTDLVLRLKKPKIKKLKMQLQESFEEKIFNSESHNNESKIDHKKYDIDVETEPRLNEIGQDISLENYSELIDFYKEKNECNKVENDRNGLNEILLSLKEKFETIKLQKRLPDIQAKRMNMDIFFHEHDIIELIKNNLVVLIQGATGCGKTTQIPQFLLENGFATSGMVGITQPRRLSAISISNRLNIEINENISGFKIKYENNVTENTKIKVMTEGILFREIQLDFYLKAYSVIVLDEIHERSSTMDLLIGLLSKIIQLRLKMGLPLRLILMSATIDCSKTTKIFEKVEIFQLPNKSYKINVFFEPKTTSEYLDESFKKIKAILDAEESIIPNKKTQSIIIPNEIINDSKASILVFLPGKEDIYKLMSQLNSLSHNIVILPLHSSLSRIEQNKVFEHYDSRKIILATNIAETSITIEDVVFVIDSGRVKHKIIDQSIVMYKTMFISKSSAIQRMGRAGRTRAF